MLAAKTSADFDGGNRLAAASYYRGVLMYTATASVAGGLRPCNLDYRDTLSELVDSDLVELADRGEGRAYGRSTNRSAIFR
jgi:hypothetical protein